MAAMHGSMFFKTSLAGMRNVRNPRSAMILSLRSSASGRAPKSWVFPSISIASRAERQAKSIV